MKRYGAPVWNGLVVLCGLLGQYCVYLETPNFWHSDKYLYYTHQSNLLVIAVALLMLVFEVRHRQGKPIPKVVSILHLVSTTAITITFLVFSLLLMPQKILAGNSKMLLRPANLLVHTIVPLLAIIEWCRYGQALSIQRRQVLYGTIPPLAYVAFVFIRVARGLKIDGLYVPYFFLNYKKYGWFRIQKGLGVAYWLIALAGLVVSVSFGLWAVARRREKRGIRI